MSEELTPREIVAELDKYIIGQADAKRAVAIAVRNRWRRQQLDPELAQEIAPKNIIMIGPTGVGKTEIARRLARLVQAPFIKVEASKYTEVGYHGRDVESMVRDLLDLAINMIRSEQADQVRARAEEAVEKRLVNILIKGKDQPEQSDAQDVFGFGAARKGFVKTEDSDLGPPATDHDVDEEDAGGKHAADEAVRSRMMERLHDGFFDDREIEISVSESQVIPIIGGMGPDQVDPGLSSMLEQMMPKRNRTRRVTVAEARRIFLEEETDKLIDREKSVEEAIERTEQSGIIFLDEIDKVATSGDGKMSADVSRQGVQRDLLPIVEGSTVSTRHGLVRTDHILFVAAGAFHSASVSDLMPELQGRFPIRVELDALTRDDFVRILKEPEHSLLKQQDALLSTEGLEVTFDDDAIGVMADIAAKANSTMENIGARRLMTIVERLFEQVSFDAPQLAEQADRRRITVNAEMVHAELDAIAKDEDLSRFVL